MMFTSGITNAFLWGIMTLLFRSSSSSQPPSPSSAASSTASFLDVADSIVGILLLDDYDLAPVDGQADDDSYANQDMDMDLDDQMPAPALSPRVSSPLPPDNRSEELRRYKKFDRVIKDALVEFKTIQNSQQLAEQALALAADFLEDLQVRSYPASTPIYTVVNVHVST